MQRSLLLLENCINSEETRKQYLYYLSRFISHYSLKDCDSILAVEQKKLVVMIEDYVIHLKKQISPNTLPTYLFALKSFLEINDVNLNWKRIKRLYPAKVKLSGRKAWSNDDIKKMLEFAPDIRAKSIIHFLSSTAARIGSLPDIKLKNVEEMPDNCKSVFIYEGSTEEYYCFLIPESVRILNLYLEKRKKDGEILTPDSPLFRKSYMFGGTKGVPLTKEGIESIIRRIVHNAGLRNDKIGKRYGVQQDHSFRKRAATLLKLNKNVNANSIEKILGHKNGIYRFNEKWKQRGLGRLGTKDIEHLEYLQKDGKLIGRFKLLRNTRLRSAILQDRIPDIGKIKQIEREVNLNADRKRFWLGQIKSIDDRIMNESMPLSLNYFEKNQI